MPNTNNFLIIFGKKYTIRSPEQQLVTVKDSKEIPRRKKFLSLESKQRIPRCPTNMFFYTRIAYKKVEKKNQEKYATQASLTPRPARPLQQILERGAQ